MFARFFQDLRAAGLPVSLTEYLTLLSAVGRGLAAYRVEDFYFLSRACLVKDERNLDRFDRVFGRVFKGEEDVAATRDDFALYVPEEWLRRATELYLTDEEKVQIKAAGGLEKLMADLSRRLAEQKGRHEGGNRWIGTGGTSPFGAYGYASEGMRVGQHESIHRRAVKVWDRREFRNLDDSVELGTRNIKLALRRLRRFARQGAASHLDLPGTISATARNAGFLDVQMTRERHNAVKVLLFLDVGGSMEDHVRLCEELFSAARSEFKHLEHFYFHNCIYDAVWRDNNRRSDTRTAVMELIHTYPADYKVILVGDAAMGPYEITDVGGSVEGWNLESGQSWLLRLLGGYRHAIWLNPTPEAWWDNFPSTRMLRRLLDNRMYPLTLAGLDAGMRELMR
ncbi:MAG: VWA domain-containing protein [Rhodospirillaceae bacterium]